MVNLEELKKDWNKYNLTKIYTDTLPGEPLFIMIVGSYLAKTAQSTSDIDIYVISNYFQVGDKSIPFFVLYKDIYKMHGWYKTALMNLSWFTCTKDGNAIFMDNCSEENVLWINPKYPDSYQKLIVDLKEDIQKWGYYNLFIQNIVEITKMINEQIYQHRRYLYPLIYGYYKIYKKNLAIPLDLIFHIKNHQVTSTEEKQILTLLNEMYGCIHKDYLDFFNSAERIYAQQLKYYSEHNLLLKTKTQTE